MNLFQYLFKKKRNNSEKVHVVEVDVTTPFWKNIAALFKPNDQKAPKDLVLFRKQLAHIAIGKVPAAWKEFLENQPVENQWSQLVKAGMNRNTATNIIKADFAKTSRTSKIVNNEVLVNKFHAFLTSRSELAHRVRDSYRVQESEERERARILNKPWDQLFNEFNEVLKTENQNEVSKSCLRKIRKKYCKNFRQASKKDVEYAQCNVCSKVDMMLGAMAKNRYLQNWRISRDNLLKLSICEIEETDNCLWDRCNLCNLEQTILKLKSEIPDFENCKRQMINWPELVKYKKNNSHITKWIQQVSTIDEFACELASALFCSKTKATGPKVNRIVFISLHR